MNRRRDRRAAIPQLRHDEAVQYLVDYHFGRLSPQLNAAVEAHIRDCQICQRQGLSHAAIEKREVARKLRRVRPTKPRLSGRGRGIIFLLAILAVLQLGVFEISRGSLLGGHQAGAVAAATATATPMPTPAPLTPSLTYASSSANSIALALSPDGKTLASAWSGHGSIPYVTLWSTATGKSLATLSWPGQASPGVLAWSPDGKTLSGADGSLIGIWTPPTAAPVWTLNLPAPPALRVYNISAASIAQEPDPAKAFASGSVLRWGTNDSLSAAPLAAGTASPVTVSGGQDISLWRAAGSHLSPDGKGGVLVGISSNDVAGHTALLSWSPDSQYLFWGSVNQPVAITASQATATPSPSATSSAAASSGVPVPNAVAATVAHDVATAGHGDAFLWFAPNGHLVAVCDRSADPGPLDVYDIGSGRVVNQLSGVCAGISVGSLAWNSASSALLLAPSSGPIALYPLNTSGS